MKLRHAIKFFLSLTILIVSNLAIADTVVVLVNGADGTDSSVPIQQAEFKTAMFNNGVNQSFVFKPFSIFGFLPTSAAEHQCQWSMEYKANQERGGVPSTFEYLAFLKNLGEIYNNESYNCPGGLTNIKSNAERLAIKIKTNMSKGHKVIVVPYSQGNLYLNAAIGLMLYRGEIDDLNGFRVVNVGNTSLISIHGMNVTSTKDKIVSSAISHFPSTYTPCISDCNSENSFYELTSSAGMDIIGHCFSASSNSSIFCLGHTYLNDSIRAYQTKQTFPKIIASLIMRGRKELMNQKIASISINRNEIYSKNKWYFQKILAAIGIRSALAQSVPSLFAYINQSYTVRVDGTGRRASS